MESPTFNENPNTLLTTAAATLQPQRAIKTGVSRAFGRCYGVSGRNHTVLKNFSGLTVPYGRGSVCRCKHFVPVLSRDQRERSSAFFSIVISLLLGCRS